MNKVAPLKEFNVDRSLLITFKNNLGYVDKFITTFWDAKYAFIKPRTNRRPSFFMIIS